MWESPFVSYYISMCRDLLRGISNWQHPVLVLRDVPFLDLQVCTSSVVWEKKLYGIVDMGDVNFILFLMIK